MDNNKIKCLAALQTIKLNCTPEQQELLKDEFRILEDYIYENDGGNVQMSKQKYKKKNNSSQDYAYLDDLSQEAKDFVIYLLDKGEKNLYHSAMAVIDNMMKKEVPSKEDVKAHYLELTKKKKHVDGKLELAEEVFELCWERYKDKHKEKFK